VEKQNILTAKDAERNRRAREVWQRIFPSHINSPLEWRPPDKQETISVRDRAPE
jgi:hypothetical protein